MRSNEGTRDDFFTLIHKGQRRELFLATTQAGKLDWDDAQLATSAPPLIESVHTAHHESGHELVELTEMIAAAALAPTSSMGLAVYRKLSAFVAGYLVHILDEETNVMPAIWQYCTDDEIAVARRAFLADQSAAGVVRSRRAILPAVSRAERAAMATALRGEDLDAFMQDARRLLDPQEWANLSSDIADSPMPP